MKNIYFFALFPCFKMRSIKQIWNGTSKVIFGGGVGRWLTKLKVGGDRGLGSEWDFNSVNTGTLKTIWAHSRTVKSTLFRWYFTHFWFYRGGIFLLTLGTLKFLQYFFSPLCKYKLHESLHMSVYATCLPFLIFLHNKKANVCCKTTLTTYCSAKMAGI